MTEPRRHATDRPKRALVLAGGGVTGVAWEVGVVFGARLGGVDFGDADLVVGTSAGSVVASQLSPDAGLDELAAAAEILSNGILDPARNPPDYEAVEQSFALWSTAQGDVDTRVVIGQLARGARTISEPIYLAWMKRLLQRHDWPANRTIITAVDTDDGSLAAFERGIAVPMISAVAASCSLPGVFPPVGIGGRWFVDGGVRSPTNADLAAGCDEVIVVLPVPIESEGCEPARAEIAALEAAGARVVVIDADEETAEAIGPDLMDPNRIIGAAEDGIRRAGDFIGSLEAAWAVA